MKNKTKIKHIAIEVAGTELKLSQAQVEELYEVLRTLLGNPVSYPVYTPTYYPTYPQYKWNYGVTTNEAQLTTTHGTPEWCFDGNASVI